MALAPRSRAAFALLAAFRILPCYRRFALKTALEAPEQLEIVAELVWDHLLVRVNEKQLEAASSAAEELVPSEDEFWEPETQPFAEDAAAAVAYAAKCLASGGAQEAAWAGRRVYETIDFFVTHRPSSTDSQASNTTLAISHPLVQKELERQQQDLRDLSDWESVGSPNRVLETLRKRSQNASTEFFGERHYIPPDGDR